MVASLDYEVPLIKAVKLRRSKCKDFLDIKLYFRNLIKNQDVWHHQQLHNLNNLVAA